MLATLLASGRSATPPFVSRLVWGALMTACLQRCIAEDIAADGDAEGGGAEGGAEGAEATIGIADATPMEVDAAGGAAGEGLREVSVAEGLLMLVMRQRQASSLREWWPAFLAVHAECRRVHPVVEAVLQEAVYIDW